MLKEEVEALLEELGTVNPTRKLAEKFGVPFQYVAAYMDRELHGPRDTETEREASEYFQRRRIRLTADTMKLIACIEAVARRTRNGK